MSAQPQLAFLATGRGGHSTDPAARCPHCGAAAGAHKGVDLTPKGSWFPVRAQICDCRCDGKRWIGEGYTQPCPACNAEATP